MTDKVVVKWPITRGVWRGDLVIREKAKIAEDGESSLDEAFAKAIRQVVEM